MARQKSRPRRCPVNRHPIGTPVRTGTLSLERRQGSRDVTEFGNVAPFGFSDFHGAVASDEQFQSSNPVDSALNLSWRALSRTTPASESEKPFGASALTSCVSVTLAPGARCAPSPRSSGSYRTTLLAEPCQFRQSRRSGGGPAGADVSPSTGVGAPPGDPVTAVGAPPTMVVGSDRRRCSSATSERTSSAFAGICIGGAFAHISPAYAREASSKLSASC